MYATETYPMIVINVIYLNKHYDIISNCRTGPRVHPRNPCMPLQILFSIMWASCIITQPSNLFGKSMRLYPFSPNFPSDAYLSCGGWEVIFYR